MSLPRGADIVGEAVRRPMRPHLRSVSRLLEHLEAEGFAGAPAVLAESAEGHHAVRFVPGEVYSDAWPDYARSERALAEIAGLLRRFHDHSARFPADQREWVCGVRERRPGEVVLHGDLAMSNLVWRDARPVALIDWECAEPGPAYHDVLHALFSFVPLWDDAIAGELGFDLPLDRLHRVEVFLEAYGRPQTYAYPPAVTPVRAVADLTDLLERDRQRFLRLGRDEKRQPWLSFYEQGLADRNRGLADWIRSWASGL